MRITWKVPGLEKKTFIVNNDQHLFLDVVYFELYTLSPAIFQGRYASLVERYVEVLKVSIYNVDYLTIVSEPFTSEHFLRFGIRW